MATFMAKPGEVRQRWLLVDATDQVLGRLATKIAMALMGKHRPTYTPHVDTGDFVVVTNASKVRVSPPNRVRNRKITYHTMVLGGLVSEPLEDVFAKDPERVVTLAVRRMLPRNKLARKWLSKLKVYAGAEHPHSAQQPEPFPGLTAKS